MQVFLVRKRDGHDKDSLYAMKVGRHGLCVCVCVCVC
jgi:hypothetical protein